MSKEVPTKTFSAALGENASHIATYVSLSSKDSKKSIIAKWDTGAFMSCIPYSVVKDLSLVQTGSHITRGTFGDNLDAPTYMIDLTIPSGYTFHNLEVIGLSEHNPTEYMLIGMDVISQGDFLFSGHGGGVFSFRVPSTETVSFKL